MRYMKRQVDMHLDFDNCLLLTTKHNGLQFDY